MTGRRLHDRLPGCTRRRSRARRGLRRRCASGAAGAALLLGPPGQASPCRQVPADNPMSDGQGRARAAPLLRRAPLGQPDLLLRQLPPAGARLQRRPGARARLHRDAAPPRPPAAREPRLPRRLHLGQLGRSEPGDPGARPHDRFRSHSSSASAGSTRPWRRGSGPTRCTPRCSRPPSPGSPPLCYLNIAKAIAAFERTLISGNSPYDRHRRGDATALTASARRGMELFFSDRVGLRAVPLRIRLHRRRHGAGGDREPVSIPQHRPLRPGRPRRLSARRDRARGAHRPARGHGQVPHAPAPERGPDRPVHARRQRRHPLRGGRPLRRRGTRADANRGAEPDPEPARPAVHARRGGEVRPARLPRGAHRRGVPPDPRFSDPFAAP